MVIQTLTEIRAIHHDPELYPDPDHFRPDRWLDPSFPTYQEPLSTYPNLQRFSAFGFGKRICPGLSMAERSIAVLAARIAWACQLSKKVDSETRKEIEGPSIRLYCRSQRSAHAVQDSTASQETESGWNC